MNGYTIRLEEEEHYKLIDLFCLFYLRFVKNREPGKRQILATECCFSAGIYMERICL